MRIISHPVSAAQLRPVEAPQGIRNRIPRGASPEAGNPVAGDDKPAPAGRSLSGAGTPERSLSAGNTATVGAGVTAQKVFHAVYGGPAETSLPDANRAYNRTDSLRFKDVPFTLRIA